MSSKKQLFALHCWLAAVLSFALVPSGFCESVSPAMQQKIDKVIATARVWAAAPVIVSAVRKHNAGLSPEAAAMTQKKWTNLMILDPFVKAFAKNDAAQYLRSHKTSLVTEAFISGADGKKVCFLGKPSGWSHKGKAKHEVPMTGKSWQGSIEVDESTGMQEIQVSVPVLDSGKPIGSLVIGLSVSKLNGSE